MAVLHRVSKPPGTELRMSIEAFGQRGPSAVTDEPSRILMEPPPVSGPARFRMQTDLGGHPGQEVPAHRNIVLPSFQAVARHQGESLDVALVGDLDMTAALKLESGFEDLLAADDIRRLVFDLADLAFIDSAGLGALLAIRDRTHDLGIEMVLTNPSDPARRILELSGMAPVLLS
jgi:anti-anti-sigma factor